ncbi:MAG: YncE family protein [Adhaeribacter sp.]
MKNPHPVKRFFLHAVLAVAALFFTACDPDSGPAAPKGAYEKGVFILNEGNFQKGNSAVSFFDRDTKTIMPDIFKTVNNRPLGDVAQSMAAHNNRAYLVINNSNKVEVVDINTFGSLGTISGLAMPRYFAAVNNKGYVTEWVNYGSKGRVSVIDLNTNTVTKTIEVGLMPENLIIFNNKVYVVNSSENTISIINAATDALETTVTLAYSPNSLVVDRNNKLWVLAGGKKVYNTDFTVNESQSTVGSLIRLNPATNAVELNLPFASRKDSPGQLKINGAKNKLYYRYAGKIYQYDIAATALPTNALLNRNFYGLGVDPATDLIYGADAGFFTANGKVVRFNPNGTPLDSFQVAIGPNSFLFR